MLNARRVVNKIPELHRLIYCENYDIIFVTETWLRVAIDNGLLDPNACYHISRKDRNTGVGGGVAVFAKRHLSISEVKVNDIFSDAELLCFDIVVRAKSKLRFFVVYRPPSYDDVAKSYIKLLLKCLKMYCEVDCTSVIVGDFNIPSVGWSDSSRCTDYVSTLFSDFVSRGGFTQFVDFCTRGDNLLDLVLLNDREIVFSISAKPPLGNSDHTVIDFNLNISITGNDDHEIDRTADGGRYYWYKADFEGLQQALSQIDWNKFICCNANGSCVWASFLKILWTNVDEFVPYSCRG